MNTATYWTTDDLLVNLEAEVNDVCWFYGVNSLNDVPSFEVLNSSELHHAKLGDIMELKNGKHAVIIEIIETPNALELVAVSDTLRVFSKRI
jgi:hypothetical protein